MLPISERALQLQVLQLLAHMYPNSFVFHVPNEGKRSPIQGAILKSMGLKTGVPDLVLVRPYGRIAWLELKSQRGTVSPTQKALHPLFKALGHPVHIIKDIDQLAPLIAQWRKEDAGNDPRTPTTPTNNNGKI